MRSLRFLLKEAVQKINNDSILSLCFAGHRYTTSYVRYLVSSRIRYRYHRMEYGDSAPRPFRTIHIDPSEIRYILVTPFSFYRTNYNIYFFNGNWDRNYSDESLIFRLVEGDKRLINVRNYKFYISLENHFQKGVPWNETEFYHWAVAEAKTKNLGSQNRYGSLQNINNRFEYIDELFDNIQKNGYLPQDQLDHPFPPVNEIQVNIGRDGEIIFDESKHRFAIARILGLEKVPVRVFVRHEKWQEIRKEIHEKDRKENLTRKAKNNLDHPDTEDLDKNFE